ncbi:5-hydroxytryptamine receptor 3A-like isoform X1 [Triplophysa dalaica]|nr:5-hydroxytryptamine receptor 3A-like isoform X1 [Triplophysa dalaica]
MENLKLTDDNFQMKSIRPVYDSKTPTDVYVDLFVTSITDVNEKAQSISTQVIFEALWNNEFIEWKQEDFCQTSKISLKKDTIWIPDIVIAESIKTEFANVENPYVKMNSDGSVYMYETLTLSSACKMDLINFPFDVQTCNLTIHSPMHSSDELTLNPWSDSLFLTSSSQNAFQTQGEWELLSINTSISHVSSLGYYEDQLIYKITLKRRPLLYVITFISPVFCFLVLDLASYFIDAGGGEKLSFKVTLLLSMSVLLLILNDKLPSTANEVPWIGVYCSLIFILIGISILETILVNFLMARGEQILRSQAPIDSTSAVTDAVMNSDENPAERRCLYWTRAARIVDIIAVILYIITIMVFLPIMYYAWFMASVT